jgi:hypothetical protein
LKKDKKEKFTNHENKKDKKKKRGKVTTVVTALEMVNPPCHVILTVIQTHGTKDAYQSRPQPKALLPPFTSPWTKLFT